MTNKNYSTPKEYIEYIDQMIAIYDIDVNMGTDFVEVTTPYLPDVTEYADTLDEALILMCSSIETTEEILGYKLWEK